MFNETLLSIMRSGIESRTLQLMEMSPGYNQPQSVKDAPVARINSQLPEADYTEWRELFTVAAPDDFFAGDPDTSFLDRGKSVNSKYEVRKEDEYGNMILLEENLARFLVTQISNTAMFNRGKFRPRMEFRLKPAAA